MAEKKTIRHAQIRRIVEEENIGTQDELVKRLNELGFDVTQATASRDIKELRLSKMTDENGRIRYFIPGSDSQNFSSRKYIRIFSEAFISMEDADNILVVKTVSGMAMAAAAALDSLKISGIVGCIAGDDTIMCVIKSKNDVGHVMDDIHKLLS